MTGILIAERAVVYERSHSLYGFVRCSLSLRLLHYRDAVAVYGSILDTWRGEERSH